MRIDITPQPGPAVHWALIQNLKKIVPFLLWHVANHIQVASDHCSYLSQLLLEENFVSFLSQLAVMSIMINTFQTVFSAISRSSFSNFAFSDLVEPTMAGVSKAPWRLWRFLELLVNTFRQFDSMRKTMGGKMNGFSKAKMPHIFYNRNFPFIGEKL